MSHNLFDDDYDPLAPPPAGAAEVGPAVEHARRAGIEARDELGTEGDGGFGGGDGIVRIWFDDEGRLSRVRVSPVWFKKLQGDATLESAFHQAFRMASMGVASTDVPQPDEIDPAVFGELPPPTLENTRAYLAMINEHLTQWRGAVERAEAEPLAAGRRVTGRVTGVALTLDEHGHPHTITFDQRWLDDAQVGPIINAVMAAADKAYAQYVPSPNPVLDELERHRAEHRVLMAGLHRMFNPGR